MAKTRQKMFIEQSVIHASLEKLRMSGAAFALPPELARSIESAAVGSRNGVSGGGNYLASMRSTRESMVSR